MLHSYPFLENTAYCCYTWAGLLLRHQLAHTGDPKRDKISIRGYGNVGEKTNLRRGDSA